MASASINYDDFDKVLEPLLKDLVCDKGLLQNVPEVFSRLEKCIQHSVLPHVRMSGFLLSQSYAEICGSSIKPEQMHQAYILGWCWQMLQTFFLMMDQYLTDEKIQLGRVTWFHLNGKGVICMNDTILVEQGTYWLLQKHLGHLPCYPEILDYFKSVSYEYFLGQSLEAQLSTRNGCDMNEFTISKRLACVRRVNFKYRYTGPVQVAIIMAGRKTENNVLLWESVEKIGELLTEYLAEKHDLGNMAKGNEVRAGRQVEEGIIGGKCTWPIAKAKELCTEGQWSTLKEYYGKDDMASVEKVVGIYRQLGIPKICQSHLDGLMGSLKMETEQVTMKWRNTGKKLEHMVEFYGSKDK